MSVGVFMSAIFQEFVGQRVDVRVEHVDMLLVVGEPAALCEFRVRGGDDHVFVSDVAGDLKESELGYGVHISAG